MKISQTERREVNLDQIYGETCLWIAEAENYVSKIDAFIDQVTIKPVQSRVEKQVHADVYQNLTKMSDWIHCDILKCLNDQEKKLCDERSKSIKRTLADYWESHNYCSKSFLRLKKYMIDIENKTRDYLSRDTFAATRFI